MSALESIRATIFHERNILQPVRISAVYLVVSPCSAVLANAIGSLSEYRFPHPLLTTALHLALALVALLALSFASRALLRSQSRSRALSSSAVTPTSTPRTPLGTILSSLGAVRLDRSQVSAFAVSATLASIVSALLESRGTKIASVEFWAAARIAPLGLVIVLAGLGVQGPSCRGSSRWPWALALFLVLLVGPGLEWTAQAEAYVCAGGYALGALGWIWAIRAAMNEASAVDGHRGGPSLAMHVALSLAMLAVPLLLSNELTRASQSGHLGFFTEIGFWAQEFGLALCGLASLASFWAVVTHLSPVGALCVVSVKEFLLPSFYAFFLSNPLWAGERGAVFSRTQQWIALVLLGSWTVAELVFEGASGAGVASKGS